MDQTTLDKWLQLRDGGLALVRPHGGRWYVVSEAGQVCKLEGAEVADYLLSEVDGPPVGEITRIDDEWRLRPRSDLNRHQQAWVDAVLGAPGDEAIARLQEVAENEVKEPPRPEE